jgi:hypothetical protein
MVLAMEAGMMIYHIFLWPMLARTGYAALTKGYPLFGYWLMVASMMLGMLAFMRLHCSTWRHGLEMTFTVLAPLAASTILVVRNVLPIRALYAVGDPVMMLAMAAYMLYHPHGHAHGGDAYSCR